MRELLLSIASPEFLSWSGFLLLALGLLGEVAVLVEPFEQHWTHKPLGFAFAAVVLVGYVIGHVGDDAISAKFESRATKAETALEKITSRRTIKQAQVMVEKLKPFAGATFDMGVQTDGEAVELLAQLAQTLTDSGWVWKPAASSLSFNIPGKPTIAPIVMSGGVQILLSQSRLPEWGKAAGALVEALKAEDITAIGVAAKDAPDTAIHVNVGTKPQ